MPRQVKKAKDAWVTSIRTMRASAGATPPRRPAPPPPPGAGDPLPEVEDTSSRDLKEVAPTDPTATRPEMGPTPAKGGPPRKSRL